MIDKQVQNLLPQAVFNSLQKGELNEDALHLLTQLATKVAHEYLFKSEQKREEVIINAVGVCKEKFDLIDSENYSGCYDFFYNFIKGDIQKNWRRTLKEKEVVFRSRSEIIKEKLG